MSMHDINAAWSDWLWQTTWQAAMLTAAIGCITLLLRRWISPQARQAIWLLVFVRLVMPVLPGSQFSIWGLYAQPQIKMQRMEAPSVHYDNIQPSAVPERITARVLNVPAQPSVFEHPQAWLTIIWAMGAVAVAGYAIVSTLRFSRAIRRTSREPDAATASLIDECCLHARIKLANAILTDKVATPALFGVFRPMLLLPPTIVSTLDRKSLRNVVLHELQHLKRRHLAMDWLLTAIRAIHWFNPAAWWAHRQVRAARELICDQAVIASLGGTDAPRHYGNTLLTIASGALRADEPALIAAFAREHRLLRERIETISRFGKVKYIAGLGVLLSIVLVMAFLTSPGNAQQAQPASRPATTMPMGNIIKYTDNWPNPGPPQQPARVRAEDEAVYAALERKLPEVRLDNVSFSDVVTFLRDVSSANIYVNWRALETAGVDRKALVSAQMRDIKFSKVLQTILTDVGGGNVRLSYTVDEGVLTISTEEDLASNITTFVYDIRDLIFDARNPQDAAKPIDSKLQQDLTTQVIKLIEDTVSPDSWKDNGGSFGTIRELSGQLVIVQTPENHRKVRMLLDQFRETRAIQIRVEAQILEVPAKAAAEMEQRLSKDGQLFLDDAAVRALATQPGVRVIGKPSIMSQNGQDVMINIGGGEGESFSLRVQSTISADRKYVTVTPSMIYSPTSSIAAEERQKLSSLGASFTIAQLKLIQAKQQFGPEHPTAQKAQADVDTSYAAYKDALDATKDRLGNGTKPAEDWLIARTTISVPDGGTLLLHHFKHSIYTAQPDGSVRSVDAPPGDKAIWLLIRPTIVIQREKEQEQFPLLQH